MPNRIRELRISYNLTQNDLAKNIGLNQSAIGKYEREELEPNIETLKKLSTVFECSIDYLLGFSDDFGNITVQTAGAQLTTDERQLIEDYRDLTPALQKMLRATIETWKGSDANESKKRRDIQTRRA